MTKKAQDLEEGDVTASYEVLHKPLPAIVAPGKNAVLVRVQPVHGQDTILQFDYDQDVEVQDRARGRT